VICWINRGYGMYLDFLHVPRYEGYTRSSRIDNLEPTIAANVEYQDGILHSEVLYTFGPGAGENVN